MRLRIASVTAMLALVACAPQEPIPITPKGDADGAAVVRRALPPPAPPPIASIAPPTAIVVPPPAIVVPPNALYVCVSEAPGQPQQTAIEFNAKVGELCKRHPEMGPCQYERNVCRRSGGRVYAANGQEITMQTEAEYDRKVLRVRFKAN